MKTLIEQCDYAKSKLDQFIEVIDKTKVEDETVEAPLVSSPKPHKSAFFHPGIIEKKPVFLLPGGRFLYSNYETQDNAANLPINSDPPYVIIKSASEYLLLTVLLSVEKQKPHLKGQITFSARDSGELHMMLLPENQSDQLKPPNPLCVLEILRDMAVEVEQLKSRMINNWTFQREGSTDFLVNMVNKDSNGFMSMMIYACMPTAETAIFLNTSNIKEVGKITQIMKCQLPAAKLLFSRCGVPLPNYAEQFQHAVRDVISSLAQTNVQLSTDLQKILDENLKLTKLYNEINLFVRSNKANLDKNLGALTNALFECKFFMDATKAPPQQHNQSDQAIPVPSNF